jgi:hypothetical protein
VIVDVVGYYTASPQATGALHRALTPSRVLDTREGNGLTGGAPARVGPQESISLALGGRGGLPAPGQFSSVVLNVTAVAPSQQSHVRVYPGDQPSPPFASSLNFEAGQTIANQVTVRAAADGTVKLYNQSGSVDLVADVVGYYGPLGGGEGAKFYAVPPYRVTDTRWWPKESGISPLPAGVPLQVYLQHPALNWQDTVSAGVLTITVDQPSVASHLTAWPNGGDLPNASVLNFSAGQVIANQANVKGGRFHPDIQGPPVIAVQNNAGTVHVIADINGWFGPEA